MEWYDPSMLTTEGGDLVISLDAKPAHGLDYMGGMMSVRQAHSAIRAPLMLQ